MPTRMTAVDAQFYWMSAKVPSDEFLLYAFDGEPTDSSAPSTRYATGRKIVAH